MTHSLPDAVPLEQVRRALIIKLRHHGDVLLTSPVFSVLKNHAPQCEIDALVFADTAPMLDQHPAISELHRVDRNWKRSGVVAQCKAEHALWSSLRRRRYDLIVHLTDHPRGAWLARSLGAKWAVAPQRDKAQRWWKKSFSHVFKTVTGGRRHTVEFHLDALRRIGLQPTPYERALTLVPGEAAHSRIDALLATCGLADRAFIHFHPASRWFFKCWSIDKNAELLHALVTRGEAVVITAAPDQRERSFVQAIIERAGVSVCDLSGQLTLKELAAVSARASIFVGVDSAPMHIAAAMATPSVVLFGPSGNDEWGPWRVAHEVIASTVHPCRPCGLDGCGGGKVSDCLMTLEVSRVLNAIDRLLAEDPRR